MSEEPKQEIEQVWINGSLVHILWCKCGNRKEVPVEFGTICSSCGCLVRKGEPTIIWKPMTPLEKHEQLKLLREELVLREAYMLELLEDQVNKADLLSRVIFEAEKNYRDMLRTIQTIRSLTEKKK